ncbi:DNA topology modulation protein [Alicyclobacillus fastidiosus]|uniref:DNA topology modulation protein n=1 Tax=Alicyclobacillus fastidiosus TaxID=392011 RepID=A0ABY6ZFC1_9BACL|nr:DNA topology modulation protein [Alicyclobacillus fastidiosus]WAH41544.1 DNA topology modulation protein [Alicyclobacillus fastidiosus]GMA63199.1 topology modulation protein [Alicyclobacillus fastidiosus]
MKRIIVIGSPGAGKSTFSRELSRRLGLPLYHLDSLYWKPGWVERSSEEWAAIHEGVLAQPTWVVDGNYGSTLHLRVAAADTVIWLDLPRTLCLYRCLKRVVRHWGRTRPDMGAGCPERLDIDFLKYVWRFKRNGRAKIFTCLLKYGDDKVVYRLSARRRIRKFLDQVSEESGGDARTNAASSD